MNEVKRETLQFRFDDTPDGEWFEFEVTPSYLGHLMLMRDTVEATFKFSDGNTATFRRKS